MDRSQEHKKELILRAITLLQGLVTNETESSPSEGPFSDYTLTCMRQDLASCSDAEKKTLTGAARSLFEMAIKRKMPALWIVKNRHPVFAVYAALCWRIGVDPVEEKWRWLGDNDFKAITQYANQLIRSPALIEGIQKNAPLSKALESLPARKEPWTVFCDWQFNDQDAATADRLGNQGKACVLRPG